MDLVSRLRAYIEHLAMPVTQFADTCGIPRPSMSQLLSGRNKKVSNELIAKVHDAFPDLNVLWLMFGQGDMLVDNFIQFSEPQNTPISADADQQAPERQPIANTILDFTSGKDFEVRKTGDDILREVDARNDNFADSGTSIPEKVTEVGTVTQTTADTLRDSITGAPLPSNPARAAAIPLLTDKTKRIVNIIVYYSDNSFEAFVPETPATIPSV